MNTIISTYFTAKPDPQRARYWPKNEFRIIKNWYNSLILHKINGVILHDGLSDEFIHKYSNEFISFHLVPAKYQYSTNDYKYFAVHAYLETHSLIDNVFITDISDVVLAMEPFSYIESDIIYGGSDNAGKYRNNRHFKIGYSYLPIRYFNTWNNSDGVFVNAGVLGGSRIIILELLNEMCNEFHILNIPHRNVNMAVLNYVLCDQCEHFKVISGYPVTSDFKQHQSNRCDIWFIHK